MRDGLVIIRVALTGIPPNTIVRASRSPLNVGLDISIIPLWSYPQKRCVNSRISLNGLEGKIG